MLWYHSVAPQLLRKAGTTCVNVLVPGSIASTTVTVMEYHANASNLYYFAWSSLTKGFYNLHSSRLAWKLKYSSGKHSFTVSLIINHVPQAKHVGCRLEILNETSLDRDNLHIWICSPTGGGQYKQCTGKWHYGGYKWQDYYLHEYLASGVKGLFCIKPILS